MMTLIVLTSYVVHVFLCRWIFKKAYQLNNNEYIKECIHVSFVPILGLMVSVGCFLDQYEDKNSKDNTWFNGKNW